MGRIVAIDYGLKRCGLAISDPLGIFASGLDTVEAPLLIQQLLAINTDKGIEKILIGLPLRMGGDLSAIEHHIQKAIVQIQKAIPGTEIVRLDERFTSKMAMQSMIEAGATKKQRKNKGNIDKISATLLLQEYLNSK